MLWKSTSRYTHSMADEPNFTRQIILEREYGWEGRQPFGCPGTSRDTWQGKVFRDLKVCIHIYVHGKGRAKMRWQIIDVKQHGREFFQVSSIHEIPEHLGPRELNLFTEHLLSYVQRRQTDWFKHIRAGFHKFSTELLAQIIKQ